MNGWVVSFLSDYAQIDAQVDNNRDDYNSLSWSPYDRICIRECNNFKDFCTTSSVTNSNSSRWLGTERTIHLIFDSENTRKTLWLLPKPVVLESNKIEENRKVIDINYDFYCIVTLRYSNAISQLKNSPRNITFLNKIRTGLYNKLDCFIKNNNLDCDYRGFQSLSIEDVVLFFCANDLSTINECIKFTKSVKFNSENLFYSLSNFSGLNDRLSNANPNMNALVKLNLKLFHKEEEVIRALKEESNQVVVDEDVMIRNSCIFISLSCVTKKILSFYKKDGIFNGSSDFYRKYVKSSRTYWIESKNDDSSSFETVDNNIQINLSPECIVSDSEKINKCELPENNVANFVVNEYDRLISTQRFVSWLPLLNEQRNIFLQLVHYYETNGCHESLCDLINCTQNALLFINQACSPVYEIPYHNSFYSSSNNDLLKMYYGIISSLLQIGYSLPHKDNTIQHPIYFAVNFESTPRIHSKMFTMESSNDRFVVFFIPSDSLYNYPEMISNLIHEVFHYIAPFDRRFRTECILKLIVIKILLLSISHCYVNFDDLTIEEKEFIQTFYLKSQIVDQILDSTIKYIEKNSNDFFSSTLSEIAEKYLTQFDDFCNVYNKIYITARDVIISKNSELSTLKHENKDFSNDIFDVNVSTDNFIFDKIEYVELVQDFVRDITSNAKEVFCDIFIIRILDFSFSEYIYSYFSNLIRKSNLDELIEVLKYETSNRMNFISTDIRLLMIIEYFIKKEGYSCFNRNIWLDNQLSSARDKIIDDEKNIFDLFVHYLKYHFIDNYYNYQVYISPLKDVVCFDIFDSFFDSFTDSNSETGEIICKLKKSHNDDVMSSLDFNTVLYFTHYYKPINVTNKIQNDGLSHTLINPRSVDTGIASSENIFHNTVSSISEYIDLVLKITEKIKGCKPWFRGVCSSDFSLTPSLFRNLDSNLSLYANQAKFIKGAYEKTLSFSDLWGLSIVDQMCFLQHYGMATNLLDFSFDMLVSLHFALNPDVSDDKEAVTNGKFIPVVYIFDPIEYSNAVTCLNNGFLETNDYLRISPIVYNVGKTQLDDYFVTDMTFEKMINHTAKFNKPYTPSSRVDEYPLPIIIQQNNKRVHNQNGIFLAYSLNSGPDRSKVSDTMFLYDYLSLQNIQNQYINMFRSMGMKEHKFLYPIFIDRKAVEKIREDLKTMNITEGHLYPEFSNIFKEVMAEFKEKNK